MLILYTNKIGEIVLDMEKDILTLSKSTKAKETEQLIQKELFGTDNIGMYKYMQHNKSTTVRLNTTLDELILYFNEPNKYRPYFESHGDSCIIPCFFTELLGKGDKKTNKFIQSLLKDKNNIVKDLTGVPHGKYSLKYEAIEKAVLSSNLSHIAHIRQEDIIKKVNIALRECHERDYNEAYNSFITVIQSIDDIELRALMQYDYAEIAPKIIVKTDKSLDYMHNIWLEFWSLIGFDILILSENGASAIDFLPEGMVSSIIIGKFVVKAKKEKQKKREHFVFDVGEIVDTLLPGIVVLILFISFILFIHLQTYGLEKKGDTLASDINNSILISEEELLCNHSNHSADIKIYKYNDNITILNSCTDRILVWITKNSIDVGVGAIEADSTLIIAEDFMLSLTTEEHRSIDKQTNISAVTGIKIQFLDGKTQTMEFKETEK